MVSVRTELNWFALIRLELDSHLPKNLFYLLQWKPFNLISTLVFWPRICSWGCKITPPPYFIAFGRMPNTWNFWKSVHFWTLLMLILFFTLSLSIPLVWNLVSSLVSNDFENLVITVFSVLLLTPLPPIGLGQVSGSIDCENLSLRGLPFRFVSSFSPFTFERISSVEYFENLLPWYYVPYLVFKNLTKNHIAFAIFADITIFNKNAVFFMYFLSITVSFVFFILLSCHN